LLIKCVSTNGLLLEKRLPDLLEDGVKAVTVTVNAPDGDVGMHIYSWVRYSGIIYHGKEAAELLITQQLRGIKAALSAGLRLKVNSVLVPGINERHMVRLARRLKEIGVPLMNIMPLIPGGRMKNLRRPTCDEIRDVRDLCTAAIPQFHRCEHCRADIIRLPSH
jgi:nitrogen fixation protein NifB